MSASIWDVLGIAETTDERAIKRAYAARLKVTSPEIDAAGYMKLRDAYEAAKNHAAFLRIIADRQELHDVERPETPAAPPLSEAATQTNLPHSPQQQAIARLQSLLSEDSSEDLSGDKLDEFLKTVEAIQAAQTFVTLDEQNDFIGEVALLAAQVGAEEVPWRGHLAALLGARERENIFSQDSKYWHAYEALLDSYSEVRLAASDAQFMDHDVIAATPGYLHVFHVLTAPFDSERLMALTRSQAYHRLAESILKRAKANPAIAIPAENREWWERTAMAGQHRPTEEPPVKSAPAPTSSSSKFPFWAIWIALMLVLHSARTCSGP